MIYLDLLLNLTLLVALTIVSAFIEKQWFRCSRLGTLLQGVLFGAAAVLGMLRPLHLSPGIIFDGRSIMVSLCALFFGPLAGGVAALLTMAARIWLGGAGMVTGLLTTLSSVGIGLLFRSRLKPEAEPPSVRTLYLFGLAVHLAMVALMLTLPQGAGIMAIQKIGPPVMLLFPLATILAGKILSDQVSATHTLADLQRTQQNLSVILKSIGDAVIATNGKGEIGFMNPAAEDLTGRSRNEARGRPFGEVFCIVDEQTGEKLADPVSRMLAQGRAAGLSGALRLTARDGSQRAIAHSAAPIRGAQGNVSGAVLVLRDQSDQQQVQRLMQARLALLEYAGQHAVDQILIKGLDEACALVDSPIGFCHQVGADQKALRLQHWSTRTRKEFCRLEGKGMHRPLDQAGVWADCVRRQQPVVHNDYASLPHRQGLPAGHAEVVRELVVPILRENRVAAVLGVGNKPAEYTAKDVEIVSHLADMIWQITEKKRTEAVLQESERKYRHLFENAPIGIFTTTSKGKPLSVNAAMARILGFVSPEETLRHYTSLQSQLYVHPGQRDRFLEMLQEKGYVENFEYQARTGDGRSVLLSMNARIARREDDGNFIIEGFASDITAQRRLEEQFNQAQKMESVGRLAGGVAHDYNNMLGVILGFTELAIEKVDPSAPLHDDLQEILKAARRSADITRQLLAFARKQEIRPKVLDLNETVESGLKMYRRLIGEDIHLAWLPAPDLWPVKMDPSQIDQILANLFVNARDAIAGVGQVTIETANVHLDEPVLMDDAEYTPGDFVMITVSDDGCGMDPETLENIFEPFFTTKDLNQGTGLGLPTVYGIARQNNGFIKAYSEPGQGATFKIFLPRHQGHKTEVRAESPGHVSSGNGETILLVEDEPAIRALSQTLLEKVGYRVLTADKPQAALRQAEAHADGIRLLITDVVMPEMNGRELAQRLQAAYPRLKCLFMSGYTANVIAQHGILDDDVNFIQKPFSLSELAAKVRTILDGD